MSLINRFYQQVENGAFERSAVALQNFVNILSAGSLLATALVNTSVTANTCLSAVPLDTAPAQHRQLGGHLAPAAVCALTVASPRPRRHVCCIAAAPRRRADLNGLTSIRWSRSSLADGWRSLLVRSCHPPA